MKKKLRSGYTTGACAAAAAKAAAQYLVNREEIDRTEIPLPDGRRVPFLLQKCFLTTRGAETAYASVIKDAGDDPDVTNGAEIGAYVSLLPETMSGDRILITGGDGVGTVTKPGLAVEVGQPAINPVPLQMIREALEEILRISDRQYGFNVEITIVNGEQIAKKTLNERLGIIGGLSILGTTGIVRPVSAEAWTATISAAMNVAEANDCREIVLSTGRTSEKAIMDLDMFKEESMIMMGDYLEFSLIEAAKHPFSHLHMSGMWAKILKAAMGTPQTHVRFGALNVTAAIDFIEKLQPERDFSFLYGSNTAREIYERLHTRDEREVIQKVCFAARDYQQNRSGIPVTVYLVHPSGVIVEKVG